MTEKKGRDRSRPFVFLFSSCPAVCAIAHWGEASMSCFGKARKAWMAGTSPAMTICARTYFASARFGGLAGHDLISVS
jgi:hypothetical protein